MADDTQGGNESGGGLRKQLEDTIAVNKQLSERLRGYEVKSLIEENGWATVKPEDFEGVELAGLEEHGQKLHEQRVGLVKDLLSRNLNLEGDELEKQVSAFLAGEARSTEDQSQPAGGVEKVRRLGEISGERPGQTRLAELEGVAAIEAAFAS
jgi:hypothetical protein